MGKIDVTRSAGEYPLMSDVNLGLLRHFKYSLLEKGALLRATDTDVSAKPIFAFLFTATCAR